MLKDIFVNYLKTSRGIDFNKWSKTASHVDSTKHYITVLQENKYATPGCVDERQRLNLTSAPENHLTDSEVETLLQESREKGISLRPSMAGGSGIFITSLATLVGYSPEEAFAKTVEATEKLGWKVKAHIDNHAGDAGCGYANNVQTLMLNTLINLEKVNKELPGLVKKSEVEALSMSAHGLVNKIRNLPENRQEIALTWGSHKSAEANALFNIDNPGKTVSREDLYQDKPTFTVSVTDLANEDVYNVYSEVLGDKFKLSYPEFVELFLEIHFTTFELLGVMDGKRKNIFVV